MSFGTFARLYCGMYFDGRENNVKGASRVDEFRGLLDQFIIAHAKTQAFPGRTAPLVSRIGVARSVLLHPIYLGLSTAAMSFLNIGLKFWTVCAASAA